MVHVAGEQGLTARYGWHRPSALEDAARDIGLRLDGEQREQVAREQIRMVLLHTRFGTLAATAFAVLLTWHLHGTLPAAQLQGWLALKLAVALARIALAHAYARWDRAGSPSVRWKRAMLALLALDGLVWGVAGWRLSGEAVTLAALGVAALDGVSCVATFGLQVRLAATVAYVVPMLLPLAAGLAMRSDGIARIAAVGQLILLALLLATSRATSRRLAVGMLLRLQADRLVAEKDAALRLAREHSAERERFLAKVSHELRTPLHGMLGVVRLMRLQSSDAATTRRLELVETLGTHLQALINDLLEASVIDAGHFALHVADFDLAAELDRLAEVYALRAADKGLSFTLQLGLPRPCPVRGDAGRLRQVLQNLLSNAVKFTEQGGITLLAEPGAAADGVRITVRDTGVGLGSDDLARVFEPFQQAGSARMADGVGLGLTIAREIAVAMGGDITVQSEPGRGAAFHVDCVLPRAAAPRVAPARAAAGEPGGLPGHVLVAEDDEVSAMVVTAFLDTLGVRSERVADGQQAVLCALRDPRPDVVLMDCRMPVMDGLAAAAEIRRQEGLRGLPRLPILALTAADAGTDRAACLGAGMDSVIGKPFTREQLVQALRGACPRQPAAPAQRPAA